MPPEVDLMVRAALLANLPPAGSVWSEAERRTWLLIAMAVFELVYEHDEPQENPGRLAVGQGSL
jgi:hypothetical protein